MNKQRKIKMTHKNKMRLARKMMTAQEIRKRIPIFQSKQWEQRTLARRSKQLKQREHKLTNKNNEKN